MKKIEIPKSKFFSYPVIGTYANIGIDIWIKFTSDSHILNLLNKYKEKSCNTDEYNEVIKFMISNPLYEYVSKRLSKEKQNNIIKYVSDLQNEKLKQYIQLLQKNYDSINIYKAYILFIAKETLYKREKEEELNKIVKDRKIREKNLNKKLIKRYGI